MRKYICFVTVIFLLLSLCGCGNNGKKPEKLEFGSVLDEQTRVYYVGDEFDSEIETENGKVSRIPKVFVLYDDGTRSEDVSKSGNIEFSGYDLSKVGKQSVAVKYTENGKTVKAMYEIQVEEQQVLFIEAEDPIRLDLMPFKVGEKFNTLFEADGIKQGVTVRLHMKDPSEPYVSYFTDAPELCSAEFDTSECKLDENGNFTEAGIFTVYVKWNNFSADYKIRVEE